MLYSIFHALSKFVFKVFFNLKKIGLENIPKHGGFIITPNHKSYLDTLIVGSALPMKISAIAKKELFERKFQSWFYRNLGGFPIDRKVTGLESIKKAIEVVRNGNPLLIFPEGTRYEGEGIGKGKKGSAFISVLGKVPILPAGIAGTDRALPKQAKFPKPVHIVIVFGKPFKPWKIFNPDDKEFLDKVTEYLMKEIEKCQKEAEEKL